MEIRSVATSANPVAQRSATPDTAQADATRRAEQAKKDQEAKAAAEAKQQQEAQRPPVVNAQGQTIGRVINTTA